MITFGNFLHKLFVILFGDVIIKDGLESFFSKVQYLDTSCIDTLSERAFILARVSGVKRVIQTIGTTDRNLTIN